MDKINWDSIRNSHSLPEPELASLCAPTHIHEFLCVDCDCTCCSRCCVMHLNVSPARHTAVPLADVFERETELSSRFHVQLRRFSAVLEFRRKSLERLPTDSVEFLNGLPEHVRTLQDLQTKIEEVGPSPSIHAALTPVNLNRLSDPRLSSSSSFSSMAEQRPKNNSKANTAMDELRAFRAHNERLRNLLDELAEALQPPEGQLGQLLLTAGQAMLGPQASEGASLLLI